jgi:hypothetical protein
MMMDASDPARHAFGLALGDPSRNLLRAFIVTPRMFFYVSKPFNVKKEFGFKWKIKWIYRYYGVYISHNALATKYIGVTFWTSLLSVYMW